MKTTNQDDSKVLTKNTGFPHSSQQVAELELTKVKATELLKAHEGDPIQAMSAYVRASA